jgi:hypothetical protein
MQLPVDQRVRRGGVQVCDAGDVVDLSEESATVYRFDASTVVSITPASALTETRSLEEAGAAVAGMTGLSELA